MKEKLQQWFWALVKDARERRGDKGVTLVELLAVIAILAVLVTIAVPVVKLSIQNAKTHATEQSMSVMAEALQRYAIDHNGTYPNDADSAQHFVQADGKDSLLSSALGDYLQGIPKDGNGEPFFYKSDGTYFEIETAAAYYDNTSGEKLYISNSSGGPTNTPPDGWK